jgi:excisionase family DNA binding protein
MAAVAPRMSAEVRKQQIVRAALETIAEHGVQGATVSRIAKGAGITSAALYSHFENRHAILLAALDVVYEQVFDSFRSSSSADPLQRLREICENHAEKVRDQDPTSHAHLFLEFVASAPEEGLREALREKEFATASYLASIVGELEQQGRLPEDVDPELVAWLVAGWAWTGDVASSMGVNGVWYEQVSPRLLDFILAGLSKDTGVPGSGTAVPSTRAPRETAVDGLPPGVVFTLDEVADLLKVPIETVEKMVTTGQIRSLRLVSETRVPRRALLACLRGMTAEEFDALVENRPQRSPSEPVP